MFVIILKRATGEARTRGPCPVLGVIDKRHGAIHKNALNLRPSSGDTRRIYLQFFDAFSVRHQVSSAQLSVACTPKSRQSTNNTVSSSASRPSSATRVAKSNAAYALRVHVRHTKPSATSSRVIAFDAFEHQQILRTPETHRQHYPSSTRLAAQRTLACLLTSQLSNITINYAPFIRDAHKAGSLATEHFQTLSREKNGLPNVWIIFNLSLAFCALAPFDCIQLHCHWAMNSMRYIICTIRLRCFGSASIACHPISHRTKCLNPCKTEHTNKILINYEWKSSRTFFSPHYQDNRTTECRSGIRIDRRLVF